MIIWGGVRLKKKKNKWSALRYLIYFTQFGVTMVTPPLIFAYGSFWLAKRFGWGNGVVIVGILLGIAVAACGLRDFMRFTEKQARKSQQEEDKLL